MSVSTLTSCKRTITAPIGRLFVGCVASVYHSLVYDDRAFRYANIGKFARVWCIDGMFFEGEGEKSWALFLMRSVCVFDRSRLDF